MPPRSALGAALAALATLFGAVASAQITTPPAAPGGSSGQLQINSGGAFAGVTLAGDCTFSAPNIVCLSTNRVAFAASATTDATNAGNISSGTLGTARLSGAYTGITGVGTLSAGSIPASLVTGLGGAATASTTGSGLAVLATSPSLTTPSLGIATATSLNGLTLTANATGFSVTGGTTSKTLTASNSLTFQGTDGTNFTFPATSSTVVTTGNNATISAGLTFTTAQTLGSGSSLRTGSSTQVFLSYTAPSSPSSGLGSTTAVTYQSGTAGFVLTIGGTGITSTGTVTMPTASHGWICDGEDLTTPGAVRSTGSLATTSVTLTFYNLTGTATAPTSGDIVGLKCIGV